MEVYAGFYCFLFEVILCKSNNGQEWNEDKILASQNVTIWHSVFVF